MRTICSGALHDLNVRGLMVEFRNTRDRSATEKLQKYKLASAIGPVGQRAVNLWLSGPTW